jgi:flagellar motor switch protein FliN/FliY
MTEKENINWTIEALYEVPVQISVVLGRATIQLSNLLKLGKGAVIELDKTIGEPIDIFVNNKLVAKGEVVVVENKIGVTLTEIVKAEKEVS